MFLSVGVIDSGSFKGEGAVEALEARCEEALRKYVAMAAGLGLPACYRTAVGTDIVAEAKKLCLEVSQEFPRTMVFLGKVVFPGGGWVQSLLHNQTAFALQRRLEAVGKPIVILPTRLR